MYLTAVRRATRTPTVAAAVANHARALSIKGAPENIGGRSGGRLDDILPKPPRRKKGDLEGFEPTPRRGLPGEGIPEREAYRPRRGDDLKGLGDLPDAGVEHPDIGKYNP